MPRSITYLSEKDVNEVKQKFPRAVFSTIKKEIEIPICTNQTTFDPQQNHYISKILNRKWATIWEN